MDTTRSDERAKAYRDRPHEAKRRVLEFRRTFRASPGEMFPLLCPTREYDWIPDWACELIYTESGYAEQGCVFRTDESNPVGPGVWVMSRLVPDEALDIVRVSPDLAFEMKISLEENRIGTTTGSWRLIVTGLTEAGDAQVGSLPESDARFESLLDCLERYLDVGEAT